MKIDPLFPKPGARIRHGRRNSASTNDWQTAASLTVPCTRSEQADSTASLISWCS